MTPRGRVLRAAKASVRGTLVPSRVSHCDVRGPKRATVVGPTERSRPAVVVLDEGDKPLGEAGDGVELALTIPYFATRGGWGRFGNPEEPHGTIRPQNSCWRGTPGR